MHIREYLERKKKHNIKCKTQKNMVSSADNNKRPNRYLVITCQWDKN